mgnify:CR=1 FL=1
MLGISNKYSRMGNILRDLKTYRSCMSTPGKIIIQGITNDGRKFRPSDWAERLCGAVASYGPNRRIMYHPCVSLASYDNTKAVVIDKSLANNDEMLYDFLVNFAKENNLKVQEVEQFPVKD